MKLLYLEVRKRGNYISFELKTLSIYISEQILQGQQYGSLGSRVG